MDTRILTNMVKGSAKNPNRSIYHVEAALEP